MRTRLIPWLSWALAATGCAKDTTSATFGGEDGAWADASTGRADAGHSSTDAPDSSSTGTTGPTSTSGASVDTSDGGQEPPKYDVSVDDAPTPDACGDIDGDATLSGLVTAPEGTIPIPGAVVYFSPSAPEPIPDHVYCDECVALDCDLPHAFTNPDGTFELSVHAGEGYLVVRKGQFRRVTPIDVQAGAAIALQAQDTRLPAEHDESAGLSMPRIALGWGVWDSMEDLIATMLGTDQGGMYSPGDAGFDLYYRDTWDELDGAAGSFHELLGDLDALRQYHVVFAACYGDFFEPEEIDNLRTWVSEGGRLYATDLEALWLVSDAFPEYQTFANVGGLLGLAEPWPGRVEDDDLLAWLSEQGYGEQIDLGGNASEIAALHEVLVDDDEGNPVDLGHRTLLSAQATNGIGLIEDAWSPAAVMGQVGCGRFAYTTYHTHDHWGAGPLSAQELTMLYVILEVGVCQEFVPTPEG